MQAIISIPLTGKLTIEEDGLLDFWEKTYETFQTYEMRSFHSFTHWQMICFSFPLLFQFSFSSRVCLFHFTFLIYLTVHPIGYLSTGIKVSFWQVFMYLILFSINLFIQEHFTWKANVSCWLKVKSLSFNLFSNL